ncbi:uncharacterized protein CDV56_104573 [Aspergillus thermomutatus]|uniref:Nitroreductase domain-containing protein n=1 Tax=Aspergillus thermomutatus TaxID=41047 RepID=A0A397H8C2_ASPTH|nr:uncharacterized protein CDV56_104573 [Aspergillus thermomutatus]RHZ57673.1 hypothetical protein CDV56_104573 [Aspergillus thermomutatus]
MHNLAATLSDGFRGRRSVYALTNESTISDERLRDLVSEVVLHTPSPFNSQATRLVVLLKDEHRKLWDIATEVASSSVPPELFEKLYKRRIAMYRAGYETVLFYEDPAPYGKLGGKWPMPKDKFPQWSEHANGMHQFALWTLLEAEGLGCNLQHYSPMLDARVAEQWEVPANWSLKAQLVFGKPVGPPGEKIFEPLKATKCRIRHRNHIGLAGSLRPSVFIRPSYPRQSFKKRQREEWRPTTNVEDEVRQRRVLVEKWAAATQDFRAVSSYQLRAPSPSSALDYPASALAQEPQPDKRFVCLAPVDRQTNPRNYIHLLKFLILLYVHQDEWNDVHPFDLAGAGQAPGCHIPTLITPNPSTTGLSAHGDSLGLADVLPALFLETADFHAISMTRTGTVVFATWAGYSWFVIDQTGLDTGRMALVEYSSSGGIKASTLRRPWNMGQVMSFGQILGRSVSELAQSSIGGHEHYNQPLDMDLPILDILESARQRGEFLFAGYGSRELWSRIIEQSAPGYLDLEARGQELDFDLASLLPID